MIFMCMHSRRAQLVKRKAGTFSEFASLASEAKGLAISINQAAPSFFTFAPSGLKDKKRKQIHTKRSYFKVGKIMEYDGLKQPSLIHMDDIPAAFAFVFLAG